MKTSSINHQVTSMADSCDGAGRNNAKAQKPQTFKTVLRIPNEDSFKLMMYHKRSVAKISLFVGMPLLSAMAINNFIKGDYFMAVSNCMMLLILILFGFVIIRRIKEESEYHVYSILFRLFNIIFGVSLFYDIGIQSNFSRIEWCYIYPILVFLAVGVKEGAIWVSIFYGMLAFLILNLDLQGITLSQIQELRSRFLVSFFAVCMLSLFLEHGFRRAQQRLLQDQHILEESESRYRQAYEQLNIEMQERKRIEEQLLNAAQQWRTTFDGISDIVCLLDSEGKILRCNKAMTNLLGKPFNEIINHPHGEIIHGTLAPAKECPVERMWETRRRENDVLLVNNRWFSNTVDPLLDKENHLIGAVHIISDITDRKQAEKALRESEDLYRDLVEFSQYMICTHDLTGQILSVNQGASKLMGYDPSLLLKMNIRDLLAPEARDGFEEYLNTIRTAGAAEGLMKVQTPTGERRFLAYNNTLRTEGVTSPIVRGMAYDITDRIKAEKEIRRLSQENAIMAEIGRIISSTLNIEEVYERFAEQVRKLIPFDRILVSIVNPEDRTISIAYVFGVEVAGRKQGDVIPSNDPFLEELIARRSSVLIQTEDDSKLAERYPILLSTFRAGLRSMMSIPLISKDQVIGLLHFRSTKPNAYSEKDLRLAERVGNQIAGAIANANLFKERICAEEALRENQEYLNTLLDSIRAGIMVINAETHKIVDANPFALQMIGANKEQALGQKCHNYVCPAEVGKCPITDLHQTVDSSERILINMNKERIPILKSVVPIERKDQKYVIEIFLDISKSKETEEALRQSEEKYRTILENIQDGYFEVDLAGNFIFVNDAECRNLGYTREELIGMNYRQYTDETMVRKMYQTFNRVYRRGEPIKDLDVEVIKKDGTKAFNEISVSLIRGSEGKPIGFRSISRDVTERKRAEEEKSGLQEQLRQAQKMEAIGQLAGGVAHDFNNLLTVIKGYSRLSLYEIKEGNPLRENIEEIQKASQRAEDLTRQLLAFSRKQVLQPKVLDLNAHVSNMDKMLRRMIGEDIELVTLLDKDLGRIKADPGQIEQVILNLAVNAKDAMLDGGKLTIETANVKLDEYYARSHIGVTPGHYVTLSVNDNGAGMAPDIKERIFEPFFTTKEKGTGLGLSTVYGIVQQSGGNIWVYSELGQGTTFKIYLPRIEEETESLRLRAVATKPLQGSETILLVEDEEMVRKLACMVLLKYGYTVLEAPNGEEALGIAHKQSPRSIQLMLTDVVMPGMSGSQLAEHLKSLQPQMKVLYMSGYTDTAIVRHGILTPGIDYIQKPFSPDALASKIREVLDSPT